MASHCVLLGRDEECELLEETLSKKRMRNAILIGEPGVGKTAIVEEVAQKTKDKYIFINFDIPGAVAGTKYRGEFEKRITDLVNIVVQFNSIKLNNRKAILFIDEIHTLYQAGSCEGGINAGNILKPYLASGEIMLIGATTSNEYENTIKRDGALSRRLSPIYIDELPEKVVLNIENDFSEHKYNFDLLKYVYDKSKEVPNSYNPDISIEILDRCMAREKCIGEMVGKDMVDEMVAYMKK